MSGKTITEVVAALFWEDDRFLVCQRPAGKKRGLLWEFAGGKVEAGETKEEALARECREELAVELDVGAAFQDVTHEYPDLTVHLTLFEARIRSGAPTLLEHAAMKWIRAEEADHAVFCPADTVILEKLRAFAGHTDVFCFGDLTVRLLHPADGDADTIVYTHEDFVTACHVRELLEADGLSADLAVIGGIDWDDALSPWPAPKVFRGGRDFGGHAAAHLDLLRQTVIPAIEAGSCYRRRMIAGYSLAGLFSLWAASASDLFASCASVSGSLWYDGFTDWLEKQTVRFGGAYLSVGDREKNTKNPRMAKVEDETRRACRILGDKGVPAVFECNPGGHFRDVPARIARGIAWILKGD
ncbi:MAG: NUDIX domain-containing protein [Clostridia bacterium]|nr:NUDIX domain-containing protein [Clostridia bacterium]